MKKIEKERKWLLKGEPACTPYKKLAIWQFYDPSARYRFQTPYPITEGYVFNFMPLSKLHEVWKLILQITGIGLPMESPELEHPEAKWVHTVKVEIDKGEYDEDEKDIQTGFMPVPKGVFNAPQALSKIRWIFHNMGRKWELDVYTGMHLVTLEMEMDPSEAIDDPKHLEDMPLFLKELIIMEVTGDRRFSNKALAGKNPFYE